MNIGWIFLICAFLVLLLMAFAPWLRREPNVENKRISTKLDEFDAMLKRSDEVMNCIHMGQIGRAIEIYREDTGSSLAYAQSAIERMQLSLRLIEKQPGKQSSQGITAIEDSSLGSEVERLLIQGRKIEAIKLYRERTGVGLRGARDAVEIQESALLLRGPVFAQSVSIDRETPSSLPVVAPPDDEVRKFVLAGDKIRAIKLYRERTGVALREAKAAVDLLEQTAFHPAE